MVGSGFVTSVVTGEMTPGGQVVQSGSGVVVVGDVGSVVGEGPAHTVTRLQSTDTTAAVDAKKVTTSANTQRSQPDEVVCTSIFDPLNAPNKTPKTTGIDIPGSIYPRCK